MNNNQETCPHQNKHIVVVDAWDIHEMIEIRCSTCGKVLET
jgi:hypothetical protein